MHAKCGEQWSLQDFNRRCGVFAGMLAEQNRYYLGKAGDKSILRSAFVAYPDVYDQRQYQQAPQPQRPPFVPTQAIPPGAQNWPLPQVWPSGPQAPAYPQGNWEGYGQQQQRVAVPLAPRERAG